jgi:hypothetical protein
MENPVDGRNLKKQEKMKSWDGKNYVIYYMGVARGSGYANDTPFEKNREIH